MNKMIEKLADGFAEIESYDIMVKTLKITKRHLKAVQKKMPDITTRLWGANIVVDKTLKNPVIIGKDNSKAVFNKKWRYVQPQ